ncbi:MAG: hypothetical protein U0Q15_04190 [Kineosporiaceae bacterium]
MPSAPSLRRAAVTAVLALTALAVSACSGSEPVTAPAAALATTTPASTPAGSAPAAATTTASPTASRTAAVARPLTATLGQHLRGSRGTYRWDLTYPSFSGGPAAAEADRRMSATLDTAVAAWADGVTAPGEPASTDPRELTGQAEVTVNDGRTLQVRLGTYHYVQGAAHGISSTYTLALDVTATPAKPLLLRGLLRDPAAAYAAFRREVTRQAAADGAVVEGDGVSAKDANWAAWQSGPKGLTFFFGSYQLGAFPAADYTVPWSVARPLLTPDAARLLAAAAS